MNQKFNKFKPICIAFDKDQYEKMVNLAEEKVNALINAKDHIAQVLEIDSAAIDLKKLSHGFIEYFETLVSSKYMEINSLGLSGRKLIEAKEIPLRTLVDHEHIFQKNNSELQITKSEVKHNVKKKPYETWTKSEKQNRIVINYREFMLAVKKLEKIGVTIIKMPLSQATSRFVLVDYSTGNYRLNEEYLLGC